jgi:hypothetical protein
MTAADARETNVFMSAHAAVMLRDDRDDGRAALARLRSRSDVVVMDRFADFGKDLDSLLPPLSDTERAEPSQWAWYPWRRTVVSVPGPVNFRRLRLDRNRNKITSAEQENFLALTVGIVGLSVGHSIAHTLALEGLCGRLRLADNDNIELSNLNRIPASILDVGTNKAIVVSRRIAELDPYLHTEVFTDGLTEACMQEFFADLDLVIEECDSLDMKVRVRQEARDRGIPVLMETSDRGLFDVERFDSEPDRPLFHGLLGDVDPASLRGLSTHDKGPHVMRILQPAELSPRMAASLIEVDRTLSTWPQLGGDVQLGGATVAAAVRRFGRGDPLPSGRIRVDLDGALNGLCSAMSGSEPTTHLVVPADTLVDEIPVDPLEAVIHAIRLAPSGGNSQPWHLEFTATGIDVRLAASRTSAMDVAFRGSYVSIGAAAFNARVAAARHDLDASIAIAVAGPDCEVVVSLGLTAGGDPNLAALYPPMVQRRTNRNVGLRQPLADGLISKLQEQVGRAGARLRVITESAQLAAMAEVLAESDRIRFLSPLLHRQMMDEMNWPGSAQQTVGIDVNSLGLDPSDLAKLAVSSRAEVMALLATWGAGAGAALGENTRDRVNASSAIAVITVEGGALEDYLRGGMAAERLWIDAEQHRLAVQPVSPVFLYAKSDEDLARLSAENATDLHSLQQRFNGMVRLGTDESPVLVLRLSHHTATPAVRSQRLHRSAVVHAGNE